MNSTRTNELILILKIRGKNNKSFQFIDVVIKNFIIIFVCFQNVLFLTNWKKGTKIGNDNVIKY